MSLKEIHTTPEIVKYAILDIIQHYRNPQHIKAINPIGKKKPRQLIEFLMLLSNIKAVYHQFEATSPL